MSIRLQSYLADFMQLVELKSPPPSADRTHDVLVGIGRMLDLEVCWLYQRRYHFSLGEGWTIAVAPESAERFRLEACRWTRPRSTVWVLEGDEDRLAGCVLDLLDEIS